MKRQKIYAYKVWNKKRPASAGLFGLLFFYDSIAGASCLAGATLDTTILVDDVFVIAFANAFNWALVRTNAAGYTRICN